MRSTPCRAALRSWRSLPDKNGQTQPRLEIDPDEVTSYYETIPLRVAAISQAQYSAVSGVGDYFVDSTPRSIRRSIHVPGADATTLDYLDPAHVRTAPKAPPHHRAPVFSSDYCSPAPTIIQRCIENGRACLGWTRVFANLLICGVLTSVCPRFTGAFQQPYGWEVTDASAQMLALFFAVHAAALDFGGPQILFSAPAAHDPRHSLCGPAPAAGKNSSPLPGRALLLCFLPVLVHMTPPAIVVDWVNTFLPSTGVAL